MKSFLKVVAMFLILPFNAQGAEVLEHCLIDRQADITACYAQVIEDDGTHENFVSADVAELYAFNPKFQERLDWQVVSDSELALLEPTLGTVLYSYSHNAMIAESQGMSLRIVGDGKPLLVWCAPDSASKCAASVTGGAATGMLIGGYYGSQAGAATGNPAGAAAGTAIGGTLGAIGGASTGYATNDHCGCTPRPGQQSGGGGSKQTNPNP